MKRILIVEDDLLAAELERDYLESAGYNVTLCDNGTEGMKLAKSRNFDMVILDVMLPGQSGFAICREIRRTQNVPVIMVTARKEDADKIQGLGLGADDYVTKPFSPSELVARVKAHISIHERLLGNYESPNVIECGRLKIMTDSHRVIVDCKEISLKHKEYELLLFLACNPNTVYSKEELFDRIWGMESMGQTATVTVHINRIREKIEKDPSKPVLIQTVWGTGYRFCSGVGR